MDHICHLYIWRWLHSVQWIWVTWLHSDWTSLIKRPSCGKFSVSEVFQFLKMKKDFCTYLCSLWVLSTLYFYMSFLYANTPWVNHRLNRSRETSLTDVSINFVYGLLPNLRKEKLSKWSQSQRWVLHQPIYLQHFRLIDRVDIWCDRRLRNFRK